MVLQLPGPVDTPNEDIRTGMRLAPGGVGGRAGGRRQRQFREAGLIGWIPTGEPDATDPDLVNRLC